MNWGHSVQLEQAVLTLERLFLHLKYYTGTHVSKVLTTPWMSLLLCDWIWLCAGFLVNKAGPDSAMTVLS